LLISADAWRLASSAWGFAAFAERLCLVPLALPIDISTSVLSGELITGGTGFRPIVQNNQIELSRPNVGAAEPCKAKWINLWRKRTDNRPW
jgi:hypothetical protein